MPDLTLLKLGGSLITDKSRPNTARTKTIQRLAQETAAAVSTMDELLLVGHGSGSFGHAAAAQAGLGTGLVSEQQREGISQVQMQASKLHGKVIEAFQGAQALPFSISPSSSVIASAGRITTMSTESVTRALDMGMVPIIYGDIVPDRRWRAAILSTEALLLELAQRLRRRMFRIRRVIWLGETAGLLDSQRQTIPQVTPVNFEETRNSLFETRGTDVTGGMALRLETAWKLSSQGISSWLLDGREPGLLQRCLEGQKVPGTEILGRNIARKG